jgi:Ala-tRNA(Pro) deacylase
MSDDPITHATGITTTGSAAVVEYLDGYDLDFDLVEHPPTSSAAAEAAATGQPAEQVAKTVVLQYGAGYVLAIVPASERLDLRKARRLLGATQSLRFATEAEIARDFPVLEVGAIPPLGPMLPMAELIDRRLVEQPRILCAGGDHEHSIVVDPRDVVRVTGATVADICTNR